MEEDIKILEELKKDFISLISKRNGFVIERDKREKEVRALENLLTRYKELEEKNKTQLEAFELGKESLRKRIEYDYIAKSKVKKR